MELIDYVAPAPVNPFAEDVAQLIAASATNPNAAARYVVAEEDAAKTQYKIQRAAIDQDKTASLAVSEPEVKNGKETGNWVLVFKIKPKHQSKPRGPRTRKGGTVATADAV